MDKPRGDFDRMRSCMDQMSGYIAQMESRLRTLVELYYINSGLPIPASGAYLTDLDRIENLLEQLFKERNDFKDRLMRLQETGG